MRQASVRVSEVSEERLVGQLGRQAAGWLFLLLVQE